MGCNGGMKRPRLSPIVPPHPPLPILSSGLVLDGGCDSPFGVLFVKDILPGSVAFREGSLKPLDLIHYINGAPTQDLTLSESSKLLELPLDELSLKATRRVERKVEKKKGIYCTRNHFYNLLFVTLTPRDGKPVSAGQKSVSFLNNNIGPKLSSSINGACRIWKVIPVNI